MLNIVNRIEINRHKIKIDRGMQFAELLNGEEKERVLSIVKRSKEFIKDVGEKNNVVYNPTGMEWKVFKIAVKRYVRTDFIEPALSRLKEVSTMLSDIDGICKRCLEKQAEFDIGEYDLCDGCRKKFDFRFEIYWNQYKRQKMVEKDFLDAVEATNFPDELIGNWMLLMEKMKEEKESKHIDNALKEFIRDELMNEFINQNKQLLKKYQLWQNQ